MTALDTIADTDTADLDTLGDGLHHLWCKWCHPEWVMSPVGPGLGAPFTAWCGARAVILVRHDSDIQLPPGVCEACADPAARCVVCGGA